MFTTSETEELSGTRKFLAGLVAGALSAAIFNPTDVIKIRFQGDASVKGEPRRYPSVRAAVVDIVKHEGVANGLYKGMWTTTARSAVLSATQLSSYDYFKHQVLLDHFPHIFPGDSFKGNSDC